MTERIRSLEGLEASMGRLASDTARALKVLDYLDEHALRWIESSTFAAALVTEAAAGACKSLVAGGPRGFIAADSRSITLPRANVDQATAPAPGQGWGSLFIVPGMNESLRVNGTVSDVDQVCIRVRVEECYLHCAKAFLRSEFWTPVAGATPAEPAAFALATRFMLLATADAVGKADLSPKGDPAGKLLHTEDGNWSFPDRPGNRRVDGFRNLLANPFAELLAIVPGANRLLQVRGRTELSTNEALREHFAVDGRRPPLVVRIRAAEHALVSSGALQRARLWATDHPAPKLDATEIFKAHIKQSRARGIGSSVTRAAVSLPGVLKKSLDRDYEDNLY